MFWRTGAVDLIGVWEEFRSVSVLNTKKSALKRNYERYYKCSMGHEVSR